LTQVPETINIPQLFFEMIPSLTTSLRKFSRGAARAAAVASLVAIAAMSGNARAVDATTPQESKLSERAITAIGRHYFDPARIDPHKMLTEALDEMQRKVPELLITPQGADLSVTEGLAAKRVRATPLANLSDLWRVLHETLAFVLAHYQSDGDSKPEEIEYAEIDGMLGALDPHSNFLPPKVYNEFKVGTAGKFGGLGIVISIKDGMLTVVAPIEGTPASRADVRAGDRIMQIDDESTINMSLTDAVNKLRGDIDTKVTIVVERPGKPSRKLTLVRALINIDSVQQRLLAEDGKRIGYIRIKSFQDNTATDVTKALAELHAGNEPLAGLILDLRNNPGGLLNIAVDVADVFLRKGIIVSTVGPNDQVLEQNLARGPGTEPDYPIVVLQNEGSASASEIVAGALQANDRAAVVGRRSFGKGSVQTIFELGADTALKLTIAQYKPAGTETIHLTGVTPDVELVPSIVDADAMNIVEDKAPSERELELALAEEGALDRIELPEKPLAHAAYRLRYLQPKEDEKKAEERSAKDYAKIPEVAGDFAVGFARTLLLKAGAPTRRETIASAGPAVKEAQEAEQAKIDKALASLGIDWTKVPAAGAPQLSLAYHLVRGKETISKARAGDKVRLELTAQNVGTGPYSQLIAVADSESPLLADREFVFGRIDPGATRTASTQIELPEGMPTQDLPMELAFQEGHGITPKPIKVVVPVVEEPQPAFAFSIRPVGAAGNAPAATGPAIPLVIDVQNSGPGASSVETSATISNECGEHVFIERGRVKLGSMPAKSRRQASFSFHLTNAPLEKDCAVKLTIADFKHFIVLSKRIDLALAKGQTKPGPGKLLSPPRIEFASIPSSTAATSISLKGDVSDTDPVRDAYAFVGKRKIAYIPNADGTDEMSLSINVPLEPGTNQIVVGARDREDLVGRKLLVIERTSGVKAKAKRSAAMQSSTFLP
jgi:carboxyl-terminal processing protease